MNISMIVAMGRDNVIGKDNKMPWVLPADLKYFKEITMGHPVVCGRKTLESMGGPLKGRRNIILTRNRGYKPDWDCEVVHSVDEVLQLASESIKEVFIIGGAEIYKMFLPYASKLYITTIDQDFEGDTYFPEISQREWTEVSVKEGQQDEKNPYHYQYRVFERNTGEPPPCANG